MRGGPASFSSFSSVVVQASLEVLLEGVSYLGLQQVRRKRRDVLSDFWSETKRASELQRMKIPRCVFCCCCWSGLGQEASRKSRKPDTYFAARACALGMRQDATIHSA